MFDVKISVGNVWCLELEPDIGKGNSLVIFPNVYFHKLTIFNMYIHTHVSTIDDN